MRVLVTGSRTWTNAPFIRRALNQAFADRTNKARSITVVHGGARGADLIAAQWVRDYSCIGNPIEAEVHPADWTRYGRAAGMIRNAEMVKAGADLCLAFIRDDSRGATQCADMAIKAGIRTVPYHWEERDWTDDETPVTHPSRRVTREVHKPFIDEGAAYCGWDGHDCGHVWPCPTVQARRAGEVPDA